MRNYSSKMKSKYKLCNQTNNIDYSNMDTNFYSMTSDTRRNNPSFTTSRIKKSKSKGARNMQSENTMTSKDQSCGSGRKLDNNYKKGSTYEAFLGYNNMNVVNSNVFKKGNHTKEQSVKFIHSKKIIRIQILSKMSVNLLMSIF